MVKAAWDGVYFDSKRGNCSGVNNISASNNYADLGLGGEDNTAVDFEKTELALS